MASFMQRLKGQQNGPIDEHYHMFKVSFTKEYSQLRALVVTTEILTSINGTTAETKENSTSIGFPTATAIKITTFWRLRSAIG